MAVLKPRARIIRTIGDQLISGPEAALIELVKNAYDADSPSVSIKISPQSATYPAGRIVVADQGHGMSAADIEGKWFEPASDDKARRQTSPGGRIMLGAKGIGRFAAARLGSQLTLESVAMLPRGRQERIIILVDWDEFTADRYLSEVDIPIDRQELDRKDAVETGVRLTITQFREVWTEKRVTTLVRELRRLLSPGEVASTFSVRLDLSDFDEQTAGFDGRDLLRTINRDIVSNQLAAKDPWEILPYATQDFADYRLTGRFSATGAFTGKFTNYRADGRAVAINVPAPIMTAEEVSCGALRVRINVYDREQASIERLFERMGLNFKDVGVRAARQILTDVAGIAIFRNGFRIRPYGEPDHDWLELERQRVQDPSRKLGSTQVSGRIDIESESQSHLVERSSREGLEHNGAYERLKHLLSEVLLRVEAIRVEFREKAGLSRRATPTVDEARSLAELRVTKRAAERLPAASRRIMLDAVERDSQSLGTALDEIDEYQKLLQSRAALGLVLAEVLHEGRRILNPVGTSAGQLTDQSAWLTEDTRRGKLARDQLPTLVSTIVEGIRALSRLFRRLDPLAGRRRGRPRSFSLAEPIENTLELLASSIKEAGIRVELDVSKDVEAYGYVDDFQAALINVLENAVHWLGTSPAKSRRVSVAAEIARRVIRVRISNNGPTIDDLYYQRLFSPGFTLKKGGTGLGLAIAREACRASKGDLRFDEAADETTFVIEFPKAPDT